MDKEKEKNLDNINISNISSISIQDDDTEPKSIINPDFDITKIKVISSDICGLGKSFKIIKMIKEEGKEYYHFPLGEKLKKVIYKKICNLFKK